MKAGGIIVICLLTLMAGCGGGGGGGAASTTNSIPVTVELMGASTSVKREALHALNITGTVLNQDVYEGNVDGIKVLLVRANDNTIAMLLPPTVPEGDHVLELTIDGKGYEIPLEIAAPIVAPREQSLSSLDNLFVKLRSNMDEMISVKTATGAPQSEIDDLYEKKSLLDTTHSYYAELTDQQIDYLNKMLLFANRGPVQISALSLEISQNCKDVLDVYWRELAFSLMLVSAVGYEFALSSILSSGPLSFLLGAGLTAMIIEMGTDIPDKWVETWDACVSPDKDVMKTEAIEWLTTPYASSLSVYDPVYNENENPMDFRAELPQQFTLETEYGMPELFRESFSKMRALIDKLSWLIPDALEGEIREKMNADPFVEIIPSNLISITDISKPNVRGVIEPVDENSFNIAFYADEPFSGDPVFTFVLDNPVSNVRTLHTVNLEIPKHCPAAWAGGNGNALFHELYNKCVEVIEFDDGELWYREYKFGLVALEEAYKPGATDLAMLKGLSDIPEFDGISVSNYPRRRVYSSVQENEVMYRVLEREERYRDYLTGGHLASDITAKITNYTSPFKSGGGDWISVIQSVEEYYSSGYQARQTNYSGPLKTENGQWTSVRSDYHWYYEGGLLREETYFTDPFEWQEGWASLMASSKTYHENGSIYFDTVLSPVYPALGESFITGWDNVVLEQTQYDQDGYLIDKKVWSPVFSEVFLVGRVLVQNYSSVRQYETEFDTRYSVPLQQPDGTWTSVIEAEDFYNNRNLIRASDYSEPLQNEDGSWTSYPEMSLDYSSSGEIIHTTIFTPYQDAAGIWGSYQSEYLDHVGNCYIRYNINGDVIEDTCL